MKRSHNLPAQQGTKKKDRAEKPKKEGRPGSEEHALAPVDPPRELPRRRHQKQRYKKESESETSPEPGRPSTQPSKQSLPASLENQVKLGFGCLTNRQLTEDDLRLFKKVLSNWKVLRSERSFFHDFGVVLTNILGLPSTLIHQFVLPIRDSEVLFQPHLFTAALAASGPKLEPALAASTVPFIEGALKVLLEIIRISPESHLKINVEAMSHFGEKFEECLTQSSLNVAPSVEDCQLFFKAEQAVKALQALLGRVNTLGRRPETDPAPVPASKKATLADPNLDEVLEHRFSVPQEFHFRTMELELNPDNLTLKTHQFLRRIRLPTPFTDLEEYLDFHFRLLWEDFFGDIKVGLSTYKQIIRGASQKTEIKGLKFHRGWVSGVVAAEGSISLRLTLEIGYTKMLSPNRFTEGRVVVVSQNEFSDFVCFLIRKAALVQVNNLMKKMSFVELQIEPVTNLGNIGFLAELYHGKDLQVAESSRTFQGVASILHQLRRIKRIPFAKIFVQGRVSAIEVPIFLKLDLQGQDGLVQRPEKKDFWETLHPAVLKEIDWEKKNCEVDLYQKRAIEVAFIRNVTLIQGPPGTGKTTVAVEIIKRLLGLRQLHDGPVFVICSSDSVLDQLIMKLLHHSQKIVRLGGISKIETMEAYSLDSLKVRLQHPHHKELKRLEDGLGKLNETMAPLVAVYNQMSFCQLLLVPFPKLREIKIGVKKQLKAVFGMGDFLNNDLEFFEPEPTGHQTKKKNRQAGIPIDVEPVITERLGLASYKEAWESLYMAGIESDFSKNLDRFLKSLKSQMERDIFRVYLSFRTHGLPDFALGLLYALDLLDLNQIKEDLDQLMKQRFAKQKNTEKYEPEKLWAAVQRQLFEQMTSLVGKANSALNLEKKMEGFLHSPPLSCHQGPFNTNWELIQSHRTNYTDSETAEEDLQAILVEFKTKKLFFGQLDLQKKWQVAEGLVRVLLRDLGVQLSQLSRFVCALKNGISKAEDDTILKFLNQRDIIFATVPGITNNLEILRKVDSKVTVVEEAAEVAETQIVASLTESAEHLILIGDHQQLQPKVSDMHLADCDPLDISLYERLMSLGFPVVQLRTQRRMRPEISEVVRLYYPPLEDGSNVFGRPGILHMPANIFFFTHRWPETANGKQNASKKNIREAMMVISFVEYLLQIGYKHDEIIILSLYAGQIFHINAEFAKRKKSKHEPTIRVCTVDDYQGEECRIVVLSLVRSNPENKIGFLRVNNRINAAFSRSRDGLFIFGDAVCIGNYYEKTKHQSPDLLIHKALVLLSERGRVFDSLTLSCRSHKTQAVIRSPEDLHRLDGNFCKELCGIRARCGHSCERTCHTFDISRDDPTGHEKFKCQQKCARVHECGHHCGKDCDSCKRERFVCRVKLIIDLPNCHHRKQIECNQRNSPSRLDCFEPCKRRLDCGHPCEKCCGDPCGEVTGASISNKVIDWSGFEKACKIMTEITRPCSHPDTKPCGMAMTHFIKIHRCRDMCLIIKECGHVCQKYCHYDLATHFSLKDWHDRTDCSELCQRQHPCGHPCNKGCGKCASEFFDCAKIITIRLPKCSHSKSLRCGDLRFAKSLECLHNCERKLVCGHDCRNICQAPCTQFYTEGLRGMPSSSWPGFDAPCKVLISFIRPCGHQVEKKCGMNTLHFLQNTPCPGDCLVLLDCGHRCPRRCHISESLFGTGLLHNPKTCRNPCNRKHRCGHPCNKLCGDCYAEPFLCNQPIFIDLPACGHKKKILCRQVSDKSQYVCVQKCQRKLKCGHSCLKDCKENCEAVGVSLSKKHQGLIGLFETPCEELVDYRRICGHMDRKPCGANAMLYSSKVLCTSMCQGRIECGHPCQKECNSCRRLEQGKLAEAHGLCSSSCMKLLLCGHRCKSLCHPATDCPKCDEVLMEPIHRHQGSFNEVSSESVDFDFGLVLLKKKCFEVYDPWNPRNPWTTLLGQNSDGNTKVWRLSCGDAIRQEQPWCSANFNSEKRAFLRCPNPGCPYLNVTVDKDVKTLSLGAQLHSHAKQLIKNQAALLQGLLEPLNHPSVWIGLRPNHQHEVSNPAFLRISPGWQREITLKSLKEQRFDNRLLLLGHLISHIFRILTLANFRFAPKTVEILRTHISEFLTPSHEFVGQIIKGLRLTKALVWFTKLQFAIDSTSLGTKISSFFSFFSKSDLSILEDLHARCVNLNLNLDSQTYKRLASAEINRQIEQKMFVKHSEELFVFVFPEKLPGFNVSAWKTCPRGHFVASQLWGVTLAEAPCNSCASEDSSILGVSRTVGPPSQPPLQISKERMVSVDLRTLETEDDWSLLGKLLSPPKD